MERPGAHVSRDPCSAILRFSSIWCASQKSGQEEEKRKRERYLIKFVNVDFLQGVLAAELVELMMHPLED